MKRVLLTVVFVGTTMSAAADELAKLRPEFEANWNSLNARSSPDWFADAKFGIFIHVDR